MPSVITPAAFSSRVTDSWRDRWTGCTMAAVVEALAGTSVLVELDNQTGHAWQGELLKVVSGWGGYNFPGVSFKAHEQERGTLYRLYNIGTVVAMGSVTGPSVFDARRIYRQWEMSAIRRAQDEMGAGREWGSWTAEPGNGAGVFYVRYTPHTGNPYYADKWGTELRAHHVRVLD
jgi:hypothetical protein